MKNQSKDSKTKMNKLLTEQRQILMSASIVLSKKIDRFIEAAQTAKLKILKNPTEQIIIDKQALHLINGYHEFDTVRHESIRLEEAIVELKNSLDTEIK